ncbi:hypothetical protein E4T56_gene5850 [Termitomyces sp. T112]|nr:hypothetical protein E4T56_gene5850 [Termitomyces sp. T112]
MSFLSSTPSTSSSSTDVTARKEAIMTQVRTEIALANAQELINVRHISSPNLSSRNQEISVEPTESE